MMLENVLDTQNMVVGRQENFLRRLEENSGKVNFFEFLTFRNQISGSPWERKTALRE